MRPPAETIDRATSAAGNQVRESGAGSGAKEGLGVWDNP